MAALFWQFLFYSFMGFLLEVAFARFTGSRQRERKCHLLLPVCPVYGVGGVLLGLLPSALAAHPLLLLPLAAGVCTAAEWGMSLFYEKAAGAAFWDYSGLPGSLRGRVCPLFSLFWGLLSLPLIYWVQPRLSVLTATATAWFSLPFVLLYAADAAISLALLRRGGRDALSWRQLRAAAAPEESR